MLASHASEPVVGAVASPFALKHCYTVAALAGLTLDPKARLVDSLDSLSGNLSASFLPRR